MKIIIEKGIAKGVITAPPSKSMTHRLLICAALSKSQSTIIHGISNSVDVDATLDCLKAIGVNFEKKGETIDIRGIEPKALKVSQILQCRESGSTLRFFIPICLISGDEAVLKGSERLMERPLDVYKKLCQEKNLKFQQDKHGVSVKGPLTSGTYEVAGNVSSQFISGLLFVLPLLDGDSTINITTPIESKSYIDMTISAMEKFGVTAKWQNENTIFIKGNQSYSPKDKEIYIEGDYSNAAFFEALNLFGGNVKIENLSKDSLQGDKVYRHFFWQLKEGRPTINISDCPDLGPILFAVAAAKNGGMFLGTSRLKLKESDRGEAMAQELVKFGIDTKIFHDEIIINCPNSKGGNFQKPSKALCSHNDHRIVMAEAVLLTLTGGVIEGAEAVNKSFPDFFEKLATLGIEVKKI